MIWRATGFGRDLNLGACVRVGVVAGDDTDDDEVDSGKGIEG